MMRFALLNMLGVEFFVRFQEVDDALNQSNESRDTGPTEQEVEKSLSGLTYIKLVNAEASHKNS
jgi:hypothetical protein